MGIYMRMIYLDICNVVCIIFILFRDRWGPYKKRQHLFLCSMETTADGLLALSKAVDGSLNMVDLMMNWETDCPGKAPGQGEQLY